MITRCVKCLWSLLKEALRHPDDKDEAAQRKRLDQLWTDGSDFSDRP